MAIETTPQRPTRVPLVTQPRRPVVPWLGFLTCPALDTPPRSTTDHHRCQSALIDSSFDDPAPATPSSHYTTGDLMIIPRQNPKIRPCTPEPCRMVGRGTLSALPRGDPPVGYAGGSGVRLPHATRTTRRLVEHPGGTTPAWCTVTRFVCSRKRLIVKKTIRRIAS